MKEREETCLFVRKGRETAPIKGQGRNLSICQERKGNGAHERTRNHGKTGQRKERTTIKRTERAQSHSVIVYMETSSKKPR
jgi:hypothetical protein